MKTWQLSLVSVLFAFSVSASAFQLFEHDQIVISINADVTKLYSKFWIENDFRLVVYDMYGNKVLQSPYLNSDSRREIFRTATVVHRGLPLYVKIAVVEEDSLPLFDDIYRSDFEIPAGKKQWLQRNQFLNVHFQRIPVKY